MDAAEKVQQWTTSNYEFRKTMYEIADGPHTEAILRGLLSSVQPSLQEHIDHLGGRRQASDEHHPMVQSLRDSDFDRSAELFTVHLESALERLRASLSDEESLDPMSLLRGLE